MKLRNSAAAALTAAAILFAASPAQAETCDARAIKTAVDKDANAEAFVGCQQDALSKTFSAVAADLFDAAFLLRPLYERVDPDFAGEAEDAQSPWQKAIRRGRAKAEALSAVDWEKANAQADAGKATEDALTAAQALVGKIRATADAKLEATEKLPFCKVMENWRRARQLRKRFNDCGE